MHRFYEREGYLGVVEIFAGDEGEIVFRQTFKGNIEELTIMRSDLMDVIPCLQMVFFHPELVGIKK